MRLPSKSRPVVASFVAAAVALLPILAMALFEITAAPPGVLDTNQLDDAGFRGAGLALAASPFLYIAAVPVCHVVGSVLVSLGFRRLGRFLAGTAVVAVLLGVIVGAILSAPSRFGLGDVALSIAVSTFLFLVTALLAALSWWLLAVQPHNPPLNTDAPPIGGAPVS
jgi:hypothetical protein